ncbi:MAG: hypothetical protein K9J16_01130 [Melioribacteraceae bacterium]|nr:hypothetical protein [Melioribacteraceae bacterium]MCF8356164.1 hypothetical protein [Melioribacteraceae bacterium]MCF8392330.1 hypothetical protein [Melioribacteraceae bacterium]MCF8417662.1 hypothetical protein [Melioribacteraceae bacterium]
MKKIIFLLLLLCMPLVITAQNINGRVSSSFYTFERFTTASESNTYVRNYESLMLNVNEGKVSLRTRLNFETNLGDKMDYDPRVRFYNLYVEARDLFDVATIKVGRQTMFNGIASGLYDGAHLKLKYSGYSLSGFYGGNVPAYQKMELTDSWSDDYVLGGKFTVSALEDFHFAVSYIDKNFKPYDYIALRLDEELNPVNVLIRQKSNQYKFLSGEAVYSYKETFTLNTQYDFDLNYMATSKFEAGTRIQGTENLGVDLYYNYREPRVRYNSIFSVFDYGNTQEIEAGLDYKFSEVITAFTKFGNVKYKDASSQRITLGLKSNYGSISYRNNSGYAGELSSISAYTAHSFMDGYITPSLGVSFTTYRLEKDADKNNLTSFLAGMNVRPWKAFSFDVQMQYFNNVIYRDDFRVLLKINHWFNTNLDIL